MALSKKNAGRKIFRIQRANIDTVNTIRHRVFTAVLLMWPLFSHGKRDASSLLECVEDEQTRNIKLKL